MASNGLVRFVRVGWCWCVGLEGRGSSGGQAGNGASALPWGGAHTDGNGQEVAPMYIGGGILLVIIIIVVIVLLVRR